MAASFAAPIAEMQTKIDISGVSLFESDCASGRVKLMLSR
jgi:hypothetical protein